MDVAAADQYLAAEKGKIRRWGNISSKVCRAGASHPKRAASVDESPRLGGRKRDPAFASGFYFMA
ncbi:hypothetical protein [Sphingopyxis sp.]|uniref:hypothetical protein n=1 Tax=Sphingopyxis sp. TaxID=1908224 RepID=UPI001D24BA6D|nr:hypothetical protein [Sphingopyxis sp.]MBW8297806.1 hypothetical protein [Sphingopyxis sp.]